MNGDPVIERVASVGSTNAELAGRLIGGTAPSEGVWLVADRQTAGRGRLGRDWHDGAGNFMGSTVVYPAEGNPAPHTLALVAGIAVYDAVARAVGSEDSLCLKWPNDILMGGAKLAGILLEKVGDGVIVGIGVNLVTAPKLSDRKTVSLAEHGVKAYRDVFAFHLAVALCDLVAVWRENGLAAIIEKWVERGPTIGTPLRANLSPTESIDGHYDGLNEDGSLRMRLDGGALRAIHAGEVSLLGGE